MTNGQQRSGSNLVQQRNDFFRAVLNQIAKQQPSFRPPTLSNKHYIAFTRGSFGHYAVSFNDRDGRLRVGVLVDMKERESTKRLFDALYADRDAIERLLGGEALTWERKDASIRSWFGWQRPVPDLDDEQDAAAVASWTASGAVRLMSRMDDRLRREANKAERETA